MPSNPIGLTIEEAAASHRLTLQLMNQVATLQAMLAQANRELEAHKQEPTD